MHLARDSRRFMLGAAGVLLLLLAGSLAFLVMVFFRRGASPSFISQAMERH